MKKLFLGFLFILFTVAVYSQSPKSQYIYCELLGRGNLSNTKVRVEVDFGQQTRWGGEDKRIRNDKGEVIVFNSMVDAMNWFGQRGWEFCQAYAVTSGTNTHTYHWLLKLNISDLAPDELEKVKAIFKTKADFRD